jgi:hypothetical protein
MLQLPSCLLSSSEAPDYLMFDNFPGAQLALQWGKHG